MSEIRTLQFIGINNELGVQTPSEKNTKSLIHVEGLHEVRARAEYVRQLASGQHEDGRTFRHHTANNANERAQRLESPSDDDDANELAPFFSEVFSKNRPVGVGAKAMVVVVWTAEGLALDAESTAVNVALYSHVCEDSCAVGRSQ